MSKDIKMQDKPEKKDEDVVMQDKPEPKLDKNYFDRQLRVLGLAAMEKLRNARVLICGMDGLGVEVAKNTILTGVNTVFLHDDTKIEWMDLAANFYVTEHDIGSNKVDATLSQLKELNSMVTVERLKGEITEKMLKDNKVSVIVFCGERIYSLSKMNQLARKMGLQFLAAETRGLFGCVFTDFGEKFTIVDENGEAPVENTIVDISNESPGFVSVLDDKINHGLGLGDKVIFYGVEGMTELNDMGPIDIGIGKKTGKHSFTICDTTKFGKYKAGTGYCKLVKQPKVVTYKTLTEAIADPEIEQYDFGKIDKGHQLHAMFDGLNQFVEKNKRFPKTYNEEDAKALLELTKPVIAKNGEIRQKKLMEQMKKMMEDNKRKMDEEKAKKKRKWDAMTLDEQKIFTKREKEQAEREKKKREELKKKREEERKKKPKKKLRPIPPPPPSYNIEELTKILSYTCRGVINPLAALIGGFLTQEILKAVSGKYTPLNQWFYIDAVECLKYGELPTEEDAKPIKCRYDGQIAVFGKKFQAKLAKSKIFVVGAGALGCEYMKNFALLGVSDDETKSGIIKVTDMDNIEISNLNRQFLFRERHVGSMKSVCAKESTLKMNPHLNILAYQDKVGEDTEETFNANFWENLDCVINALDNVKARLYVDSKCLYFQRPLLEAGTLGAKANTQVVYPHLTESYGAQRDPAEETFPSCTIKNFPYKIEHTIAWARDLFQGFFVNVPKKVNQYLKNPDFIKTMIKENERNPTIALNALKKIYEDLSERPTSFEDCIKWARKKFEKLFHNDICQLLFNFPLNFVTDSGLKFWSGSKRPPVLPRFDIKIEWHREFLIAAANLRAEVYGLKGQREYNWLKVIDEMKIKSFEAKKDVKIKVDENDDDEVDSEKDEKQLKELVTKMPPASDFAGVELKPLSFEKDDDKNFHIDFITSSSNNRANNYKIPIANKYKTKGIAGKIIPAMVTTTALITGFGCLEFYKVVQKLDRVERFRNVYVNLALPSCDQSEPKPPVYSYYFDKEFTDWNRILMNAGKDLTLEEFLERFKKEHKLEITSLTYGSALLYMGIPDEKDMKTPLSELCLQFAKPHKSQKYLDFVVLTEDEKGDDVDVPAVKYQFRFF